MVERDPLPTYVALDLETTGLNPDQDTIIEIGAVKFQRRQVLETFQTLVNPYRELSPFIKRLTGIAQKNVDRAPPFASVAGELQNFIGSFPIVGHHVSFDMGFLSSHGVQLNNEVYDTWDLASILLPYYSSYSLSRLAGALQVEHTRPHRALPDAQAARGVFTNFLERADSLEPEVAGYIHLLSSRARLTVRHLFEGPPLRSQPRASGLRVTGLDLEALANRLGRAGRSLRPSDSMAPVDEPEMATYLAQGGVFSQSFPGFEHRPQQVEMMTAVASAINCGEHLIVEGGTGVGKSLAYLLPAILHALKTGSRVVVSTNTINLQEQLLKKDIPALVAVLEEEGIIPKGEFRAAPLKGRGNYLCMRRWNQLARGETLSTDEALLLSKTLVWLQDSKTGDRGEINLSGKVAAAWGRISADEGGQCPVVRGEGFCFLRTARDRAEGAHMVVVNHALLLSDLALGGGLLPEYKYLIIDEAHHLEEEATRQLGSQVSQTWLSEALDRLGRLLSEVRVLLRGSSLSGIQVQRGEELTAELETLWLKRMKEAWDRMWALADRFLSDHENEAGERSQLRVTSSTKAQPGWSDLEIAWENVDVSLGDGIKQAERLYRLLGTFSTDFPVDTDNLLMELSAWQEEAQQLQDRLRAVMVAPVGEQRVDWLARVQARRSDAYGRSNTVAHFSAPLDVGPELEKRLFSRKSSVILTGATLSTLGNFDYMRERTGLAEGKELLVGSPFNYQRGVLLLAPEDIPTPDAWGYQQAMENVLVALAEALGGRTLALFTSHSALKGVATAIRSRLDANRIRVLAQGVDGTPAQILQGFNEDPRGIILGTSSFWEGIDLAGGVLKSVVVARLPFHVPTEPIFAARSVQYEDSFHEYALPQAILRYRQGIGRLIRSSQDKGTIVVLDRRIISRSYGKSFLNSMPSCTVKLVPLSAIASYAADWVEVGDMSANGGPRRTSDP